MRGTVVQPHAHQLRGPPLDACPVQQIFVHTQIFTLWSCGLNIAIRMSGIHRNPELSLFFTSQNHLFAGHSSVRESGCVGNFLFILWEFRAIVLIISAPSPRSSQITSAPCILSFGSSLHFQSLLNPVPFPQMFLGYRVVNLLGVPALTNIQSSSLGNYRLSIQYRLSYG